MKPVFLRHPRQTRGPLFASCLGLALVSSIAVAWGSWQGSGQRPLELDPVTLRFEPEMASLADASLVEVSFALPALSAAPEAPQVAEFAPTTADLVLRAIAEVESRGDPACVGGLGERGLYQFRRATWRQHTREDFRRAHHPEISTTVARRHYEWIVRSLRANGRPGTPYEVALAWNAGLSRVLSGRVPSGSRRYAQRVANLVSRS